MAEGTAKPRKQPVLHERSLVRTKQEPLTQRSSVEERGHALRHLELLVRTASKRLLLCLIGPPRLHKAPLPKDLSGTTPRRLRQAEIHEVHHAAEVRDTSWNTPRDKNTCPAQDSA